MSSHRSRGVSAPPPVEWTVQFDPKPRNPPPQHVSAHKGKYPDELINHFSVGYTVGDGGFSKVKLARHRMTGIKVAIKMISKDILQRQGELFRAANEIAALQLLKHQNIARLFQVLESRSRVYLVMEHLPAGELFDYIVAQGRIRDESVARKLFRQIVAGVAHTHQEGFSHRDLKPENMLFDDQKALKLIDFGLVAMPGTRECRTSCGSANYAAPEVIKGEAYDGCAADMWSLGIVAYAMLCGCLPFDDPDLRVLGTLIRKGKYSEPAHLSDDARDMIRRLLTLDVKERMQMDELIHHPWIIDGLRTPSLDVYSVFSNRDMDEEVLSILGRYYDKDIDTIRRHLEVEPYDHVTADYELVCIAKTRRIPLRLVEGNGQFLPRQLPELESDTQDDLLLMNVEQCKHANSSSVGLSSSVSSTISTPSGSRCNSPNPRRPRGMSDSVKDSSQVGSHLPGNWLSTRFNSMRTLAQPLIVQNGNLGINYKTRTEPDIVRQSLHDHLCSLPGEVRVKNRMFRLDMLMCNEMTDNQEIRLHFEIVCIVDPKMTGIRVTRVKGDRLQVQNACTGIFQNFTV